MRLHLKFVAGEGNLDEDGIAEDTAEWGSLGFLFTLAALSLLRSETSKCIHRRVRTVDLTLANGKLGAYFIQSLRGLSGSQIGDPVLLRLARTPCPAPKPVDPRAWLYTLVPLQLHPRGIWDHAHEYWGEQGKPIEE
jgi:hypothetical protein